MLQSRTFNSGTSGSRYSGAYGSRYSGAYGSGAYGSHNWGTNGYSGSVGTYGSRGNISPYRGTYGGYGRNYGSYGNGRIVTPYYGSHGGGSYGNYRYGNLNHGYNNWNNRPWDHGHDYAWNHHRYHWYGNQWAIINTDPYYYSYDGPIGAIDYGPDYYSEPAIAETEPAIGSVTVESNGASLTVDVQRALAESGYYHGEIDGILGPATRDAIAKFQADQGLEPTGRITQALVRTLGL